MMWRCGNPRCERAEDIGWHARKVEYLEETIGPVAAQEFEQEHLEQGKGDYPADFAPLMDVPDDEGMTVRNISDDDFEDMPDPTHAPSWERAYWYSYIRHDPFDADHRGRCDECRWSLIDAEVGIVVIGGAYL